MVHLNFKKIAILSFITLVSIAISIFVINMPRVDAATSLVLSLTSGVAGSEVTFNTASGFDASTIATITWDGAPLVTTPSTVTTTSAGAFPANVMFVVPAASIGAHTIRVSTSAQIFAVTTFTISTPTISVSSPTIPTAGLPVGTPLTIIGTGFDGLSTVTIYFDNISVGTITSSYTGAFEYSFPIKDVNNSGAHVIKAQSGNFAIANITITIATPTLTLTPSSGPTNLKITATGTNFKVNSDVTFSVNGTPITTDSTVTAGGSGSFVGTFSLPDNIIAAANTIKAASYDQLYAVATFTVSSPSIILTPAGTATAPITPGLSINIVGSNFKANSEVTGYINGTQFTFTNAPVTTNSLGSFGAAFTFPQISPGIHTIRIESSDAIFALATVTVANTSATITPTSGPSNFPVFLSGSGFDVNATLSLFIDGELQKISQKTNSGGAFYFQYQIPEKLQPGAHTIRLQTGANTSANTTYTVTASTLTISPATGTVGSSFTLSGTNFLPKKTLSFDWNGMKIVSESGTVVTSSSGTFTALFKVPVSAGIGTNLIGATTGEATTAIASYTVVASTLSIYPVMGQAGSYVQINGYNFTSKSSLTAYLDNDINAVLDSNIQVSENSVFSVNIKLPDKITPGVHTISFKQTGSSSSLVVGSVNYTVTEGVLSTTIDKTTLGQSVIVTGKQFNNNSTVTLYWDSSLITVGKAVVTDGLGGFTTTITVPDSYPGKHVIKAATSEFFVDSIDIAVDTPTLTMLPVAPRIGDTVTLTGQGYYPSSNVIIEVNRHGIKVPTKVTTDTAGNFKTSIKVPFTFNDNISISAKTKDYDFVSDNFSILNTYLPVIKFVELAFILSIAYYLLNKFIQSDYGKKTIANIKSLFQSQVIDRLHK